MRTVCIIIFFHLLSSPVFSQVAISGNAAPPDANTMLDIRSTNKGVKFPRLTSQQRKAMALSAADAGLMVYDTDKQTLYMYDGFAWQPFALASAIPANLLKKTYPAPGVHYAYRYGWSASLEGDHAVVGAPEDTAANFNSAGSVFTYKRVNGVWQQQQRLTAPNPAAHDLFGSSVAVAGNYIAIGAPGTDGIYNSQGAVFIYFYNGSNWQFHQKLVAGDPGPLANFGSRVCLDGSNLAIAAINNKIGNNLSQGSVYIFRRLIPNWTQQAKIFAADGEAESYFGSSIDLEGDYLAIGSNGATVNTVNKGAAYIYVNGGGTYTLQQKLFYTDGTVAGYFGSAVSLEGNDVLIGASGENYSNYSFGGRAFLFTRTGATWAYNRSFEPTSVDQSVRFGTNVLLKNGYAFIAAPGEVVNGIKSGQVYLYKKEGNVYRSLTNLLPAEAGQDDSWGFALDFDGINFIMTAYFAIRQPGGTGDRGAACFGSVE